MDQKMQCRTCLVDTGDLFEVFGETGVELRLHQKLQEYLNIQIDTEEYALMCGKCINILNDFDGMYILAHEVQNQLMSEMYDAKSGAKREVFVNQQDESTEGFEEVDGSQMGEVIIEEAMEDAPLITFVDERNYQSVDNTEEYEEEDEAAPALGEEDEEGTIEEPGETDEEPSDEEFTRKRAVPKATRTQARQTQTAEEREAENELILQVVPLNCPDCSHTADTMETLMFHIRQKHKRVAGVMCCNREFRKRIKLVEHAKLHLDPKAFACSVCEKQFSSKYTLSNHMGSHIPEDKCEFVCEVCPKKFSTKARLVAHQKNHAEPSFECHICKKSFTQKCSMVAHIKQVHERTSDAFICEVCAKSFKTREAFLTHQANHLPVPPPRLACPLCTKKLKNRESLNQHILRHKRANDQIFCDICNKDFNCKKRLNQHKKYVHSEEKLQCEHCDKSFKRPISLKEHMASHTGETLYTCSYCPRQFNSNANKYSHQKAQHPKEWQLAKQKRLEE